jgi:hypothetical protein
VTPPPCPSIAGDRVWISALHAPKDGRSARARKSGEFPDLAGFIANLGRCNQDVLVSITKIEIATSDRVLEANSKLKTAGHLALGLVRQGREIGQEYSIGPATGNIDPG